MLYTKNDVLDICFDDGYNNYIVNENKENHHDYTIEVIADIPSDLIGNTSIFEASNNEMNFWNISKRNNETILTAFDALYGKKIQQISTFNNFDNKFKIYSNTEIDNKIYPLKYPMGPLILYYITTKSSSIMIHASGVNYMGKGYVFSGLSGIGKSTSAKIFSDCGGEIINDDRLIIRKENNGFYFYNTPMPYEDNSKKAPLNSVFLLKQSKQNYLRELNGVVAFSSLLSNCIQHNYDKKNIEHHLAFLSDLCNNVKVFELGFKPDESVIDLIMNN